MLKDLNLHITPTLCSTSLTGPWQVVLIHPTDPGNWYIYNTSTGVYVRIGRVGAKRTNYRVVAEEEAAARNRKAGG